MKTFFLVLLLVAIIGLLLPLAFLYWRFQQSPAHVWKSRLIRLRDELFARRRVLLAGSAEPALQLRKLSDDYFRVYLTTIPTSALTEFPGIGPGTVDKLRQVGLKSVADLPGFVFESIPGIGPAKGAELRSALSSLLDQSRARFDAGACLEGQQYRTAAAAHATQRQQREQTELREVKAIDTTLAELETLQSQANGITFGNFLRRKPHGVSEAILAAPLPVVRIPDAPLPPTPPIPTPPPVLATVPVLARKTPTPMVFPPSGSTPKKSDSGDLFGEMLQQTPVKPTPVSGTELPGRTMMRTLAGFGLMVAKADGRLAQAERKAVRGYLETCFGSDPVLVRFIDVTLEETEKAIPNEVDAVNALLGVIAHPERTELFTWAERIADASGERNAKETELLERVRTALGVEVRRDPVPVVQPSPPAIPVPSVAAPAPKVDPRTLLDIAPEVEISVDLIRRRFALLSEKLDPNKAAAMGAEFAKLAEEKRAKLRAAAEELLQPFGEPLDKPAAPTPTDLRHNPDLDDAFGM